MSNYKNRLARGQCASCTNNALPGMVRCEACLDRHREKWRKTSKVYNELRRERAFKKSLARERRLEEIDERLKAEIVELERALAI